MFVEDIICTVCELGDDEGNLLLCDACPRAMHTTCIGLTCIPPGDWFCKRCEKMGWPKKDCWTDLKSHSTKLKTRAPKNDCRDIIDFCLFFGIVIMLSLMIFSAMKEKF